MKIANTGSLSYRFLMNSSVPQILPRFSHPSPNTSLEEEVAFAFFACILITTAHTGSQCRLHDLPPPTLRGCQWLSLPETYDLKKTHTISSIVLFCHDCSGSRFPAPPLHSPLRSASTVLQLNSISFVPHPGALRAPTAPSPRAFTIST